MAHRLGQDLETNVESGRALARALLKEVEVS
jgi:hypothetical protein